MKRSGRRVASGSRSDCSETVQGSGEHNEFYFLIGKHESESKLQVRAKPRRLCSCSK